MKTILRLPSIPQPRLSVRAPPSGSCAAVKGDVTPSEVKEWARKAWLSEIDSRKPDAAISLAKASLLIALEEEAAAAAFHAVDPPLLEQSLQHFVTSRGSDAEKDWLKRSGISEAPILWDLGSASSWSLSRLDSLADDVTAAFRRLCGSEELPDSSLCTPDPAALHHSPCEEQLEAERRRSSGGEAESTGSCDAPKAADFPMLALSAVNDVVFEQHGYKRMPGRGDPRDMRLPQVMERGCGSPAALAILYLEVCRRIGLPVSAALLEDGHYTVVWPSERPLQLSTGDTVVVDVYSSGSLCLLKEVQQLFGLPDEPLRPATTRELLCALLETLRDVHWAKAVGCRPEPALMTRVGFRAVILGDVGHIDGFQAERALAAAERAVAVCPHKRNAREKLAALLYASGSRREAARVLRDGGDEELLEFADVLEDGDTGLAREWLETWQLFE